MKSTQVLPMLMIVLSVGAAIVYAVQKDARHAIYWTASAVLIASVTF